MQEAIAILSENHEIFRNIIEKYGMPQIPRRPQGFATLVLLILEQQVSIDSAKATYLKIKTKIVDVLPEAAIQLSDEEFRALGVSRQKTTYIKGLAAAILSKKIELESLPSKSAEQVRAELIQLKGIGNWTIDVYMMFSLEAPDIIPLADIGVISVIRELLDIHDKQEMMEYVEQWSPYRTAATYLLWHYYLQKRNRKINYNP
jgi:DNA-3-methyladenine glycosylase II